MQAVANKKQIIKKLKEVLDPELGISVVDLGLIYDVKLYKLGKVKIVMTLTSIGCPLFELMAIPIKKSVKTLSGVKNVEIELTFDPPWTMEKISQSAREQLGLT